MRVAVVYLGRKGAGGRISMELARALQEHGPVLAVVSGFGEALPQWKALQGIELLVTETFQSALKALFSLLWPRAIDALARRVAEWKPDAIVITMSHPWNAALQARLAHIPALVFVHDPEPHPDLPSRFYAFLEDPSLRRAATCVIMSDALLPHLTRRGVRPEKVAVFPIGPMAYPVVEKKPSGMPTLLFFGRIVPYKGLEVLLEAYRRLRQTHTARLLLVGEGDLSPYQATLSGLPDVELVNRWVGEDEIGNFFSQADLVVLPYTSASQSGVIPIAATLGLPVLATRTGGIPEQMAHAQSGWLVDPGSADALLAGFIHLLDQPEKAQQLGRALKEEYAARRSWSQTAGKLIQLIETAKKEQGR